jgi:serine/threonine-protein kinase SRPK3
VSCPRTTLGKLRKCATNGKSPKLTKGFLRDLLKNILKGLDYLHRECHVIHAGKHNQRLASAKCAHTPPDIKASNILLSVHDQAIFSAFEEAEKTDPTPFKVDGGNRIYCSRDLNIPDDVDLAILTDFGNAHIDNGNNTDDVQPWQYRAPEVILEIPWSYEIDIWNVGVLVRSLHPEIRTVADISRFGTCLRTKPCSRASIRMENSLPQLT